MIGGRQLGRRGGDGWWHYPLRVRFNEVDSYRCVWHGRYLDWCEEARIDLARGYEMTPSQLESKGYRIPLQELSLTFKTPAGLDDDILVKILHTSTERAVIEFDYTILHAESGRTIAVGWTRQVVTDCHGELLLTYPVAIRRALVKLAGDQSVAKDPEP